MNYSQMDEKLKSILDEKRYNHSKGVESLAVTLANIWGADVEKAGISALLHDNAKNISRDILKKKISGITTDENILENPPLWHGPVGASLLKTEYGVDDEEIYNAVYYHTTGRKNMSLIERIIYISDVIEPSRDEKLEWAKEYRELAKVNLDMAIIKVTDKLLEYLKSKNVSINPAIYDVREDAINRMNKI